jgi:hypothetical protein
MSSRQKVTISQQRFSNKTFRRIQSQMRLASLILLPLLCATAASADTPTKHAKATHSTHASLKHTSTHASTHATAHGHSKSAAHVKSAASKPSHAPMDTERATAIQTALIKAGYLSGAPTGKWDADSMAAMQKLQADNGWQTKIVPDSRALIQLGLGPQQATR